MSLLSFIVTYVNYIVFTVRLFFNELHDLYSDVQLNVTAKLLCICAGGDLDDEISYFHNGSDIRKGGTKGVS